MELTIVERIEAVPKERFDTLDRTAGAAGCYERLRQREADGRWSTSYLRWADSEGLRAAVPFYAPRGRSWPDPAYHPSTWHLPEQLRRECAAGSGILIGGCADRRSGLPVDPAGREQPGLREALAAIAAVAAASGRWMAFPYVFPEARRVLADVTGPALAWSPLGREAQLRGVGQAWEDRQKSRVRGVLRRDRRLIAEAGVAVTECAWPEAEDRACELIAAHNVRKGEHDHPEFVRMRYREWEECPAVELWVFAAAAAGAAGLLTSLVWDDELELQEIGLSGDEGPARLAVYLTLLFHHPLRFARARGLRKVRAGFGAEVPKASRGAMFAELSGGVLDAASTRRMADGGL
jgi:hypothetical protein